MTATVVGRKFRSVPHRDALRTWTAISDLLTRGNAGAARQELDAVAGIAASMIADLTPKDAPIVVTCDGPRTRIYCLYDDDALDASDANEDALGFDPLKGDWRISLPCPAEDLAWVQRALGKHGSRVTARGPDAAPAADQPGAKQAGDALQVNLEGFLGP